MTTQSPDELALIDAAARILPGAEVHQLDDGTLTVRTPRGGNNWPLRELDELPASTRDQAEE